MSLRSQQTISRPVSVSGIGFLTGADLTVRFFPAPADHGITFVRTDLDGTIPIPAVVENTVPRSRRTALQCRDATIELVEHAMAALAGLGIDNCCVEVNGPEIPGCDGSSRPFVDALLDAGLEILNRPRRCAFISDALTTETSEADVAVHAQPIDTAGLRITYELDYGPQSAIPAQSLTIDVTPESFIRDIAFARTFIQEAEVQAFLAQGMGQRLSFRDLLIYGTNGVVGNQLRARDECVRHKILDCVGDLALLGCDVSGHITFRRSGHRHNAELVRVIRQHCPAAARGLRDAA